MGKLPIVICSSVVRSSQQGESHGGIYLLNFENGNYKQVVNWEDESIDWQGRGGERGLRGITFYDKYIICAASNQIIFYDQTFNIVKTFKNDYLNFCHEIFLSDNKLYITSTEFDSILVFDLITEKFIKGYVYRTYKRWWINRYSAFILRKLSGIELTRNYKKFYCYNPNSNNGPKPFGSSHINNVTEKDGSIYFSGTAIRHLIKINEADDTVSIAENIPGGTHNVTIIDKLLIYNNTKKDTISIEDENRKTITHIDIPSYNVGELLNSDIPNDHARQSFGRGLSIDGDFIFGGSSPSTITLYSLSKKEMIKSINISSDIRNAIHGLEIYPFEVDI